MFKSLYFRFPAILAVGLLAAFPAYAGGGGWFIKPLGLMNHPPPPAYAGIAAKSPTVKIAANLK